MTGRPSLAWYDLRTLLVSLPATEVIRYELPVSFGDLTFGHCWRLWLSFSFRSFSVSRGASRRALARADSVAWMALSSSAVGVKKSTGTSDNNQHLRVT